MSSDRSSVGHLLAGAEDVGVVLGHAPHAGQPVHDARLLVAVDGAELEQPQRQLAVGALPALVDEDVERAVHRLQVVAMTLVELHRREHALGEPLQVAGGLEQLRLGDVGRVDELVARLLVACSRVVLHHLADESPLGMEDRQPRAELGREREQVELGTEAAVVAALGLLEPVQMGLERLVRLPRGPVDPLQLWPVLVAAPVGAGHPRQLEVAEPVGRGHVGTAAEVDEARSVPVRADRARAPRRPRPRARRRCRPRPRRRPR